MDVRDGDESQWRCQSRVQSCRRFYDMPTALTVIDGSVVEGALAG